MGLFSSPNMIRLVTEVLLLFLYLERGSSVRVVQYRWTFALSSHGTVRPQRTLLLTITLTTTSTIRNLSTQTNMDQNAPSPAPIDDDDDSRSASPDLPLTMTASAVLQDLPKDATAALASAGTFPQEKVVVRFKPVGSAPALAQDVCKISSTRKFEEVVRYLRRKLKCKDTDSVFLYVNSVFAPSLDEVVGNLHQVREDILRNVSRLTSEDSVSKMHENSSSLRTL